MKMTTEPPVLPQVSLDARKQFAQEAMLNVRRVILFRHSSAPVSLQKCVIAYKSYVNLSLSTHACCCPWMYVMLHNVFLQMQKRLERKTKGEEWKQKLEQVGDLLVVCHECLTHRNVCADPRSAACTARTSSCGCDKTHKGEEGQKTQEEQET